MVEQAMAANRDGLDYLDREFGIRFDDVDLSQFPETISTEFPPEAIASLAEVLNEQSHALERAKWRRRWRRKVRRVVRRLLRSA